MECTKDGPFYILIFVSFAIILDRIQAEIYNVTACHGTQNVECDYFSMSCEPGSRIRILEMIYGHKGSSCRSSKNRCKLWSSKGCCVYDLADCFEHYTSLHAYNLYQDCSMQESCGDLPAPNHVLSSCDNHVSTYVHLTYECIPFHDDAVIAFCEDTVIYPLGVRNSIVFRAETNSFTGHTCTCRIATLRDIITTTFVDVRMFKEKTGTGSTCSSARLLTSHNTDNAAECSSLNDEEDNFVYEYVTSAKDEFEIILTDLNKKGPDDVPALVWILVEDALRIECSPSDTPSLPTTVTTTPKPTTVADTKLTDTTTLSVNVTQTTNTAAPPKDGNNNIVIVAGVVASVITVVVVGIIVVCCKRQKRLPKGKMARQNSYIGPDSMRSSGVDVYDEITDSEPNNIYDPVYESKNAEPMYDPVYDPRPRNGAAGDPIHNENAKTHTYQNVGKNTQVLNPRNKDKSVIPKRLKAPFSNMKKQTSKFVDFLKSRGSHEPTEHTQRSREASGGSYDHLHGGIRTKLDISSPIPEPGHLYSHTEDIQKPSIGQNFVQVPICKVEQASSDNDPQAVHVGDQYIEFQFDVDKNDPNLVKLEESISKNNRLRPTPPTREPPSLNSSRSPSPLPSTPRSPSPVITEMAKPQESLDTGPRLQDSEQLYDYADPNRISPIVDRYSPGFMSSQADATVTNDQPSYDYADVSNDEKDAADSTKGEPVYEDDERKLKEASVERHKSDGDVSYNLSGYEIPITSKTRPVSSPKTPASSTPDIPEKKVFEPNRCVPLKPQNITKSKDVTVDLKSELQLKLIKNRRVQITDKPKSPVTQQVKTIPNSENSDVVKSDNVSTKDYEKVSDKKSVLNMAKVFEQKNSK